LKIETKPEVSAALRTGVRIGESVSAFGFPLAGLLATGGNFTTGNVSAVAGLGNDTRFLQISAPVQPGNSGGPLLDQSGNVVGVVASKLNVLRLATATNDVAQNVNFAIKTSVLTNFLEANGVNFTIAASGQPMQSADIAERAKDMSVLIVCEQ
jgi:S1-C subfamily serine protease